jgi:phosphoribosylformylglycinamidine cyclo-ligase
MVKLMEKYKEASEVYKKAGVDTYAGQSFVKKILPFVRKTYDSNVLSDLGGFSALYDLSFLKSFKEPVILTSTDGVGTKLTYASFFKRFDTIGYDLVAMCGNDILVSGGKGYIFLDYLAVGKLNIEDMSYVVRSIAAACKMIQCNLMGGETAEHPGVMKEHDFDLAGFMIGFCEKDTLITGQTIEEGDLILGIPSSGIHSNGLSLIRKLFFDPANPSSEQISDDILNFLKEDILLQPTVLYQKILIELVQRKNIKGMIHITGGGYFENIPRILKENFYVELNPWELKSPFKEIAKKGNLDFIEMAKIFNCGYGMLIIVNEKEVEEIKQEIIQNIQEYKKAYLLTQKEFFPEHKEWEKDWQLKFFIEEPTILGIVKKDPKNNKKVVFR